MLRTVKHLLIMAVLSVVIILTASYCTEMLKILVNYHSLLLNKMGVVFTGTTIASTIKQLIGFILIPIIVGIICKVISMMFKRDSSELFVATTWVAWIILVTAVLVK